MTRIAIAFAALCACGGGTEDLTCDLLADPSNCWASAVSDAAKCIPQHEMTATLAADRQTCTYPDGSTVHFDTPLPQSTIDLEMLAFDVSGSGCSWRFVDTFHNRLELTVDGDLVVSELHDGQDFHLHCGGTTYETDFDTLFTCQPPAAAPTDGFEVTPTSVQFTLSAVGAPSPLIKCAMP